MFPLVSLKSENSDDRTARLPFPARHPFLLVKILLFLLILASLFGWIPDALPKPPVPQRIISMSPSITEILFEIGAGDHVVGVTNFCSYPKEACTRPKIGGLLNPSIETWVTLKPDLIIHQTDSHKLKANAENLGIRTLGVTMKNLDEIYDAIRRMGDVVGQAPAARQLVQRLQTGLDGYRKKLAGKKKKSVLLLLGDTVQPERDLYAVSRVSFLGELLDIAGGDNIVRTSLAEYPKISKEFIISRSPEVIIEAGPKSNLTPETKAERLQEWQRFASLRAVQSGQIHFIGSSFILIPGPRLLETVGQFARTLHPELFSRALLERNTDL